MGLLHTSILSVLDNAKVVGLCERSSVVRKVARRLLNDAEVVDDVTKLAHLDLDAIYVTTPIPTHFSICRIIFAEKMARNLFVEKTLANNFSESNELCEIARLTRGTLMVGYHKRYSVTFRKAKNLLQQKAIGNPSSFGAYAYSSDFSGLSEKSKISGSRGGVLVDLGSHVVDLAHWFFGNMTVERANLHSITGSKSEDSAEFDVYCENDAKGSFDVSWCKSEYRMPEFGFTILGTKGEIRVNDDEVELKLKDKASNKWYRHDLDDCVGFLIGAPEYYREDEHFVKSALTGQEVESDFSSATVVDGLLEQVKKKAEWK
jgi:predicted dehydrogenase